MSQKDYNVKVAKLTVGKLRHPNVFPKLELPKIHETIMTKFRKSPETFLFTSFGSMAKRGATIPKAGDRLKVSRYVFGSTPEEQAIIDTTYKIVMDEESLFDEAFTAVQSLKVLFQIKQGVTFFELEDTEHIMLVILKDDMDGVLLDVEIDEEDSTMVTVTQSQDLFTTYNFIYQEIANELIKNNEKDKELVNWVCGVRDLTTDYLNKINDKDEFNGLAEIMVELPKPRYKEILTTVEKSSADRVPFNPFEMITA